MSERVAFTKIESLQNDFLIVQAGRWTSQRAAAICDRRTGVGADGLIYLSATRKRNWKFRLYNSDGSQGEWSGNGVRCAAAYLARRNSRLQEVVFQTAAGPIRTLITRRVRKNAEVSFERPCPHVLGEARQRLHLRRGVARPWMVDAGNPHWIFIVKTFQFDWETLGAECQSRARATRGVNVAFVRVRTRRRIDMQIYERGVGPTPSSGSCALAAVAVCQERDLVDDLVNVESAGGVQRAATDRESGLIRLSSSPRVVFDGHWEFGNTRV